MELDGTMPWLESKPRAYQQRTTISWRVDLHRGPHVPKLGGEEFLGEALVNPLTS